MDSPSAGLTKSPPIDADPSKLIQRLPEHVVNKIAAGEIIHRPCNAIKEMMENSLDAGATMIRVQMKDGGLKMLQIQDDGSGVAYDDLPLLCERFATSKLKDFSDLSKMTTFGFRGEALASISYVSASMSVLSRTKASEVAYRANYLSGELSPPKPGQPSAPKPSAGSIGTTITIEDLFYNVPQRRKALRSASDEYNLTLEVMSKYAIHYAQQGVGFTCKKVSANVVDLSTPGSRDSSTIDAISSVYGSSVAKELHQLGKTDYPALSCSVQGWVSGPNWSAKRGQFICFINNRLVDCPSLKRSLLALYSTILPRGGHPWIYLSIDMATEKVDVNVHPTKREVHFLDEEEIVEAICNTVQQVLESGSSSRNFRLTQSLLPGPERVATLNDSKHSLAPSSRSDYPQHTLRVDARTRTLDAMSGFLDSMSSHAPSRETMHSKVRGEKQGWTRDDLQVATAVSGSIPTSKAELASVHELREEVKEKRSQSMCALFQDYIMVGIVDSRRGLVLLQHSTKLYMVQYLPVLQEAAYQILLRQFAALPSFRLTPPPSLPDLVSSALALEEASAQERHRMGLSDDLIIRRVCERLMKHADLLREYLSMTIDAENQLLLTLPQIISTSRPLLTLERLPTLLLRLATQVDWEEEKTCLHGILQELALAHLPLGAIEDNEEATCKKAIEKDWLVSWSPILRHYLPSRNLTDMHCVNEIASLPSLYSVFERC